MLMAYTSDPRQQLAALRTRETELSRRNQQVEELRRAAEARLQQLDLEKSRIDRYIHDASTTLGAVRTQASKLNRELVQVRTQIRNLEASGTVR